MHDITNFVNMLGELCCMEVIFDGETLFRIIFGYYMILHGRLLLRSSFRRQLTAGKGQTCRIPCGPMCIYRPFLTDFDLRNRGGLPFNRLKKMHISAQDLLNFSEILQLESLKLFPILIAFNVVHVITITPITYLS